MEAEKAGKLSAEEKYSKNFCAKLLNSSSPNSSAQRCISGLEICNRSGSNSIGTSNTMVAKNLDSNACSLLSSRALRNDLASILSLFAIASSMEENCFKRAFAFFSPIPATPGILSELSPQSPNISITCLGFCTSKRSNTSSTPHISA